MPQSGPRFTIRGLSVAVAVAAVLLALVRAALESRPVAALLIWFLSPLVLSPAFLLVSPKVARRLLRKVALRALIVFGACMFLMVSGGRAGHLGAAIVAVCSIWITMAFGYGSIASMAWYRRRHGPLEDKDALDRVPPDGSLVSPRRRKAQGGADPWGHTADFEDLER